MTDIATTTVKPIDRASVVAPALEAEIAAAGDLSIVAGILQAGARLSDRTLDDLERMASTARKVVKGEPLRALLAVANQIDPHTHVVTEGDALWTMHWDGLNADGSRKYPDKPETEEVFEAGKALALLLINEAVTVNSHHWMDTWPADARRTLHLGVDCSDVFVWGCADSEDAGYDDLEAIYRHWAKDPRWGTAVWTMIKSRQMPQRPVEKRIRDAGIWDMDALRAEHDLRANLYDGISGVEARQKYQAYCDWERLNGNDPLPFDVTWWEGWRRFVAANPDWHDDAWKAEEARRRHEWKQANGYGAPEVAAPAAPIDIAQQAATLANMLESAGERRQIAGKATEESARGYLLRQAAASEKGVLDALPALLAAIRTQAAGA